MWIRVLCIKWIFKCSMGFVFTVSRVCSLLVTCTAVCTQLAFVMYLHAHVFSSKLNSKSLCEYKGLFSWIVLVPRAGHRVQIHFYWSSSSIISYVNDHKQVNLACQGHLFLICKMGNKFLVRIILSNILSPLYSKLRIFFPYLTEASTIIGV